MGSRSERPAPARSLMAGAIEAVAVRGALCFATWHGAGWFPQMSDAIRAGALLAWGTDVALWGASRKVRGAEPVRSLVQAAWWITLLAKTRLDSPFVLGPFVEIVVAAVRLSFARCLVATALGSLGLAGAAWFQRHSGAAGVAAIGAGCIAFTGTAFLILIRQLRSVPNLDSERLRTAHLAHGIKNSLHGVTGFAALLDSDLPADDPRRALMQQIRTGLDDAHSRVQELMSSPEQKRRTNGKGTNVRDVVEDAVGFCRGLLAQARVQPYIAVDPVMATSLQPDTLRTVVVDLIHNAIEAMRPQGGSLVFESIATPPTLLVSDSGPGIARRLRRRIFQPRFTTRPNGNGLGLSGAAAALRQAGGDIRAGTGTSRGARIEIKLPAAAASTPDDATGR